MWQTGYEYGNADTFYSICNFITDTKLESFQLLRVHFILLYGSFYVYSGSYFRYKWLYSSCGYDSFPSIHPMCEISWSIYPSIQHARRHHHSSIYSVCKVPSFIHPICKKIPPYIHLLHVKDTIIHPSNVQDTIIQPSIQEENTIIHCARKYHYPLIHLSIQCARHHHSSVCENIPSCIYPSSRKIPLSIHFSICPSSKKIPSSI